MTTYVKLCKSQVVEKLDLMQCAADSFEQEKESGKKEMHDILAFAIVSIGYGVNLDDPDLDREFIARRLRVEKPAKSVADGSEGHGKMPLTSWKHKYRDEVYYDEVEETINEPIAISDFATRLATGSSTHVIQIDDIIFKQVMRLED